MNVSPFPYVSRAIIKGREEFFKKRVVCVCVCTVLAPATDFFLFNQCLEWKGARARAGGEAVIYGCSSEPNKGAFPADSWSLRPSEMFSPFVCIGKLESQVEWITIKTTRWWEMTRWEREKGQEKGIECCVVFLKAEKAREAESVTEQKKERERKKEQTVRGCKGVWRCVFKGELMGKHGKSSLCPPCYARQNTGTQTHSVPLMCEWFIPVCHLLGTVPVWGGSSPFSILYTGGQNIAAMLFSDFIW